jgi:hypothetical protein
MDVGKRNSRSPSVHARETEERDTKSDVERREEGAGDKNLCTVSLFRRSCGSWESNSMSLTDSGKFFSASFGEELLF